MWWIQFLLHVRCKRRNKQYMQCLINQGCSYKFCIGEGPLSHKQRKQRHTMSPSDVQTVVPPPFSALSSYIPHPVHTQNYFLWKHKQIQIKGNWMQVHMARSSRFSLLTLRLYISVYQSAHPSALHRETQLGVCSSSHHLTFSMFLFCCLSLWHLNGGYSSVSVCYVSSRLKTHHSVFITQSGEPYSTEPKALQLLAWILIYRCWICFRRVCLCVYMFSYPAVFSPLNWACQWVTKYKWTEILTCRNRSRLLSQLGVEPMTYRMYQTKSEPVNSCPHKGLNATSCDQLNDGKMPKCPKMS